MIMFHVNLPGCKATFLFVAQLDFSDSCVSRLQGEDELNEARQSGKPRKFQGIFVGPGSSLGKI